MVLDKSLSCITLCPETRRHLTNRQVYGYMNKCPHCRLDGEHGVIHVSFVYGRWNRPSFVERLILRKKLDFIVDDTYNEKYGRILS